MAKGKIFNITGLCVPELHYMVDVSGKVNRIIQDFIERDAYFTINRARQYGKTTTLRLLEHALGQQCIVIRMSFEGKEEYFASLQALAGGLCFSFCKVLKATQPKLARIFEPPLEDMYPMQALGERISEFCKQAGRRTILMIDEVDKAADNQTFLSFLGMLREMYMGRIDYGAPAFSNVILSGVHDIKNLKMKLRPEVQHNYNSPWNTHVGNESNGSLLTFDDCPWDHRELAPYDIAAPFDIDMSFSAKEIATMLHAYEKDHHTGMDIETMSQTLYDYTGGYPFLVSWLCKRLDEDHLPWTTSGLMSVVKVLLHSTNTLFDDIIKNLENHSGFKQLTEAVLVQGEEIPFVQSNPEISRGMMYGIFINKNGFVGIANPIFESYIYEYLISMTHMETVITSQFADKSQYICDGHLNMSMVLQRFSAFMESEYRDEDGGFIERHGRLLFLSFLRPIINGTGHYAVEPQTRQNTRMDIQVFYGNEEFIIELKLWHGEKYELKAYDQLTGYLAARGVRKGYLLSFCDNKKVPHKNQVFNYNGFEIYEVVVAYRAKK